MTKGLIGSAFFGVWLGCFTAAAAQLPPEIMADLYLVQAERLMKENNYTAALEAMEKIVALQKEHDLKLPVEFHFKYAQIAMSAGSIQIASESVKKYLRAAGRAGKFYRKALKLLDSVEAERRRDEKDNRFHFLIGPGLSRLLDDSVDFKEIREGDEHLFIANDSKTRPYLMTGVAINVVGNCDAIVGLEFLKGGQEVLDGVFFGFGWKFNPHVELAIGYSSPNYS